MEELIKKVSYLKGFADGLDINDKTDEGKLLKKIIEVLDEMSDAICDLAQDHEDLCDQVEAIDEDLGELEEDFYDDDDCDCDCDCDCDDDLDYFEIECPNCNEVICISEDFFDDDEEKPIICPNCDKEIELDFSCDCDCEDGCDCGCEE